MTTERDDGRAAAASWTDFVMIKSLFAIVALVLMPGLRHAVRRSEAANSQELEYPG
jgi:hypothetical protein